MSGLEGYFVGEDADGDLWIWREAGNSPVPILSPWDLRKAPDLWDAIVALVEGAS